MGKFEFSCPYCGTSLEAEETWRGKVTLCPECKKRLTVPSEDYEALEARANRKKLIVCHS